MHGLGAVGDGAQLRVLLPRRRDVLQVGRLRAESREAARRRAGELERSKARARARRGAATSSLGVKERSEGGGAAEGGGAVWVGGLGGLAGNLGDQRWQSTAHTAHAGGQKLAAVG